MLVLGLVAALALAACGDGDDDSGGAASPPMPGDATTDPTAPPAPDDPIVAPPGVSEPGDPGEIERVTPTGDAVMVRTLQFDPSEAEATDSAVLVRFWGGIAPCFVLDRYEVEETDDAVTVGLYAGTEPGAEDVACIEIAVRYEVEVPLAAPLGDRALVDGSATNG